MRFGELSPMRSKQIMVFVLFAVICWLIYNKLKSSFGESDTLKKLTESDTLKKRTESDTLKQLKNKKNDEIKKRFSKNIKKI